MKRADKSAICPIEMAVNIIGDSCTMLIVRDLLSGPKRFGVLQTSLSGVSSRTLTNKLKMLETCGIVSRKEFSEKPPRVEYALTKKGENLGPVAEEIRKFGKKNL